MRFKSIEIDFASIVMEPWDSYNICFLSEELSKFDFLHLQEYLERIDPGTNLDLNEDSIWSYHVGEVIRYKDSKAPDLLPCGYLVGGSASSITIYLNGALHNACLDALSFEMLIPKSTLDR